MNKYFAISDIHGRAVNWLDFEAKGFERNNPNHYLVSLGDFFDRGTENYEVMKFFEEAKKELKDRCILIIGNHDQMLLDIVKPLLKIDIEDQMIVSQLDLSLYHQNGGKSTLRELVGGVSFGAVMTIPKMLRIKRLVRFLESLEDYFETDHFIFTHAGINEDRIIDTWDRYMIDRDQFTDKIIVIGHSIHNNAGGVLNKGNIYNIDDGSGRNIQVFSNGKHIE